MQRTSSTWQRRLHALLPRARTAQPPTVASALITVDSNVYTGVCIDTACSLGFCAEHAAVAEMLKARESAIYMIVAVNNDGAILSPCGRCRELLLQVDDRNESAWVVLGPDEKVPLRELLPRR